MIKILINRIKIYQKEIAIAAKTQWLKDMLDKKQRHSRDVTVTLGDFIIQNVKVWELTGESNKAVAKSFRVANTSQMKWLVKPPTEENLKDII